METAIQGLGFRVVRLGVQGLGFIACAWEEPAFDEIFFWGEAKLHMHISTSAYTSQYPSISSFFPKFPGSKHNASRTPVCPAAHTSTTLLVRQFCAVEGLPVLGLKSNKVQWPLALNPNPVCVMDFGTTSRQDRLEGFQELGTLF